MFFYVLSILCWYATVSSSESCEFNDHTFYCNGIDQEDLLYELFGQRDVLEKVHLDTIIIENSNFATIEELPNFDIILPNTRLTRLTISSSSITHINDDAFESLNNLETLNLSRNNITNINFLNNIPVSLTDVILNDNQISKVILDKRHEKIKFLNLSNNNLALFGQNSAKNSFKFLDLSYNNLTTFYEGSSFSSDNLNISYNELTEAFLKEKKTLTCLGNNITKGFNTDYYFVVDTVYTSFIPKNTFKVTKLLSMSNVPVTSLTTNNKLKILGDRSQTVVDLSKMSIAHIENNYFSEFKQVYLLNLSYNNLISLNSPLFSQFAAIDLSFSRLTEINKTCFIDGHGLETLNLTGNFLEDTDICLSLPSLLNLDLSLNKFEKLRSRMFAGCKKLQQLNISRSSVNTIESYAFQDTKVETLDLSGNKLSIINRTTFSNLDYIRTLILNNNEITTINSYSFSSLRYVVYIDLAYNMISYIEEQAFYNLPSLQLLNFENNLMFQYNFELNYDGYVRSKAFAYLLMLKVLDLSNLGLTLLEGEAFYNLPALDTINLSNNHLTTINTHTFKDLPVINIYLNGNSINTVQEEAFLNLSKLQQLNFSNFGINNIEPYGFNDIPQLKFVDLRNNNLSGIEKNVFHRTKVENLYLSDISKPVILDNTVEVANLTIQLEGVLEDRAISNVYLKNLYIVDSNITLMKNNCFLGLYNLEKLVFKNSIINGNEPYIFNGLFSLKQLNLQSFKNFYLPAENMFKDLKHLEVLDLSNLNLREIKDTAFIGLSKLKELNLSNNRLINIDRVFIHTNLTDLDISGNQIRTINLTALSTDLPYLINLTINNGILENVYTATENQFTLVSSVKNLYLSNNLITNLDQSLTKLFGNLLTLHLDNNKLYEIPPLGYSKNLLTLRLDGNNLTIVDYTFKGLTNLIFLNISQNPNLFKKRNTASSLNELSNLKTWYMDNTWLHIENILSFYFPFAKQVGINNNPIKCDDLKYILNKFDEQHVDYTPYNPRYDVDNVDGITCLNQ